MTTTQAVAYSSNKKLWANMTLNDAKAGGEKIMIEFVKADKNHDDQLSMEEIKQYDTDKRNSTIKKVLIGAGVAVLGGLAAYFAIKGIKLNKNLKQQLSAADDALQQTKNTLSQTENVLQQTDDALNVARKSMGYGEGTIKAGDEILENAFKAQTKGGKANFTLAEGNEVFPNLWDPNGGNYTPNKGDIIMEYGKAEVSWGIQNQNVLKEMKAKGMTEYVDKAVSDEVDIMYRTYVGQDGRNFELNPLKFGETVPAQKKIFPAGVALDTPGKTVITREAAGKAAAAPKLGVGQFVQTDINGNPYVKDINDMLKRLEPEKDNPVSKALFDIIKEFQKTRKGIEGSLMSDATKQTAIAREWEKVLEAVKNIG